MDGMWSWSRAHGLHARGASSYCCMTRTRFEKKRLFRVLLCTTTVFEWGVKGLVAFFTIVVGKLTEVHQNYEALTEDVSSGTNTNCTYDEYFLFIDTQA